MDSQRHLQTLQDVLKFAIANSANSANSATPNQMGNGKKEFLENALKSMTVDVIQELEKAIHSLESENATVESKIEALGIVRDYGANLDFASNFIGMGGSKVVLDCLKSNNEKLKICAAYLVAELSQNNPFCQKHFLETDALEILILYTKEGGDVASSSMHAISSIVRNFEEGSAKLVELGGLKCIVECLNSPKCSVFLKSCFLLRALAVENTSVRDEFVKLGAVYKLAPLVDPVTGFDIKMEIILSTLSVLTQSEEGKLNLQSVDISEVLEELINDNEGRAECEEILKDSIALLERLLDVR